MGVQWYSGATQWNAPYLEIDGTGSKLACKGFNLSYNKGANCTAIVRNGGYLDCLDGSVIVNKVKESKTGIGFNAYSEEYVDMIPAGIVDPTKVTRSALENAASVAAMVLTTESLVTDIKEPAPAAPAMPAGGMDY